MRTRVTVARHKRRNKILKAARGFRGVSNAHLRGAKDGVQRSMSYMYTGRKLRKRDFRSLWIVRINAAARANGLNYSQLVALLARAGVALDRRALAEMAVSDPPGFTRVVETARAAG
jgi:large subunit ribosomal protein L20